MSPLEYEVAGRCRAGQPSSSVPVPLLVNLFFVDCCGTIDDLHVAKQFIVRPDKTLRPTGVRPTERHHNPTHSLNI